MARDEGILRRWSRRKTEARRHDERAPEEDPSDPKAAAAKSGPPAAPAQGAEPAAGTGPDDTADREDPTRDLPDIDSLDKDSDYSAFMREGVPEALRNQALRKLWMSDPIFGKLDGLVEYGEDYTDAATVVEGMKSAYQVGRGYLSEAEHAARTAKPEGTPETEGATRGESEETAERTPAEGDGGAEEGPPAAEPEAGSDAQGPDTGSHGRDS